MSSKLLTELQLCNTRCYKNLSSFWLFQFLTFYTLIIACFAVFPLRLMHILKKISFLTCISVVIIGNRGLLVERTNVFYLFNIGLNFRFFCLLLCYENYILKIMWWQIFFARSYIVVSKETLFKHSSMDKAMHFVLTYCMIKQQ